MPTKKKTTAKKASKPRKRPPVGVSKWNAQTRAKIIAALKRGVFRYNAAAIARVGESTLRRWLAVGREELEAIEQWAELHDAGTLPEGDEGEPALTAWGEFALAVAEAEGTAEADMLRLIKKHAKGEWRAAAWILERKNPKRYGSAATREDTPDEDGWLEDETLDMESMILEAVETTEKRIYKATGAGGGDG